MTRIPVIIERVDKLWPDWVGARVSNRTIYVRKGIILTPESLAHELRHIIQRHELGWRFLFAYITGYILSGFDYEDNWMEKEAREAEHDPEYLALARDLL